MQFVYEKMPDTLEEFKNMEKFSLKDPHSTSALFMLALSLVACSGNKG